MQTIERYLSKSASAAPLAVFRVAFGVMLLLSIVRFWAKGWIKTLYIDPQYFFPFYGFEFVKPLGVYTYLLFAVCALSAVFVALGWFYRAAIISLFVSFTYIELMDKSTYLNHYYFVSMVCLLLIFLPAHVYFSVDARRNKALRATHIPQVCIDVLKAFVCIVYVYAGLAKVNSDWLLHAQPLRIWLPAHNDMPLIGPMLNYTWVAFFFSWAGCLYDLSIPFLLLKKATRPYAYVGVIVFHVLTAALFPIGMFPYIMIVTALIFFSAEFHEKLLEHFGKLFGSTAPETLPVHRFSPLASKLTTVALGVFLLIQVALPLRYLFYPGEVFWTEEGYRFSWRVMLMEKAGFAEFTVKDETGNSVVVNNKTFLTPLQEKMMATQPDMILHYAHLLEAHFAEQGFQSPRVYVDSYVALNGRLGKPMIDPATDLSKQTESFHHKSWVLPFNDDIKGF
ncbi:MAG TPA: HTTM domain-containing protein [Chryseolinea sp.]